MHLAPDPMLRHAAVSPGLETARRRFDDVWTPTSVTVSSLVVVAETCAVIERVEL